MADYLLDCNHLSAAVRKVSPLREHIHEERRAGRRFITCHPVLCELEAGILQTAQPDVNHRRLEQLLRHVRLWPLDATTVRRYGEVFNELRGKGRALSQVDMMLAALARQHKLSILTTDRDFEALADSRTENWVGQTDRDKYNCIAWANKLDRIEDIEHNLHRLEGLEYGKVAVIMRRR